MANHTGVDGLVTVGGSTVAELMGFSIDESATAIPDNTIGSAAATNKIGRTSWGGSIECNWDETDSSGQGAMSIGSSVTIIFLPEGNTTGDTSLSGTALITGLSVAVADESIISQSFTITGTGALTYGAVS